MEDPLPPLESRRKVAVAAVVAAADVLLRYFAAVAVDLAIVLPADVAVDPADEIAGVAATAAAATALAAAVVLSLAAAPVVGGIGVAVGVAVAASAIDAAAAAPVAVAAPPPVVAAAYRLSADGLVAFPPPNAYPICLSPRSC